MRSGLLAAEFLLTDQPAGHGGRLLRYRQQP
jgi:hypothetical protein